MSNPAIHMDVLYPLLSFYENKRKMAVDVCHSEVLRELTFCGLLSTFYKTETAIY